MENFKESPLMYVLAFAVIAFVIGQSLLFIIKAWKRAKELGIKTETLKQTVTSSVLFTLAPAISILATVIVLASSLGIVLPWIRLSVVGNLAYETVAATAALDAIDGSTISTEVTNIENFSAVAWIMTIGMLFGIFLVSLLCKKISSKVNKVVNKNEKNSKLADTIAAAAFIGIIAAFIAREINGGSANHSDDAGFLSIATLISAVIIYLIFETLTKKLKLNKIEPFIMPVSMFGAMAVSVLLTQNLPQNIVQWTWWN